MKPFSNLFLTGVIVSIIVAVAGGCGDDAAVPALSEQDVATKAEEAPPAVVEWYPTPKHQFRPQYTLQPSIPAPSQSMHAQVSPQPAQQQFSWGGYVLQPVPQAWMVPVAPATGYGVTGAPARRDLYAPVPVWGQNVQPAQPTQQQSPPVQQQYYYYYPQVEQNPYAQRPWGAASEGGNSKQKGGQTVQTWQPSPGLPAWQAPAYGGYQY